MNPARLFNCCTGHAEPDWSQFAQLELAGCRSTTIEETGDSWTEGLQPASKAEFFTVYARYPEPDGTCEAVTDIDDYRDALAVLNELSERSGLPGIVHMSLMEG